MKTQEIRTYITTNIKRYSLIMTSCLFLFSTPIISNLLNSTSDLIQSNIKHELNIVKNELALAVVIEDQETITKIIDKLLKLDFIDSIETQTDHYKFAKGKDFFIGNNSYTDTHSTRDNRVIYTKVNYNKVVFIRVLFPIILIFLIFLIIIVIMNKFIFKIAEKGIDQSISTPLRDYIDFISKDITIDQLKAHNSSIKEIKQLNESVRHFSELQIKEQKLELAKDLAHELKTEVAILNAQNQDPIFNQIASKIDLVRDRILGKTNTDSLDDYITTNIYDIVENIVLTRDSKYKYTLTCLDKSIMAYISLSGLRDILTNIFENSEESYFESIGEIDIDIKKSDDICITIRDSGKGISQDVLDILGKKRITTKNNGNGIGMFESFRKLKLMNGSWSISSTLNKGTIIEINLKESK